MNRVLLAMIAIVALATAALFSDKLPAGSTPTGAFAIESSTNGKNPWTHLNLSDPNEQFQFAVVSDRTGGHRANVFSKAVHQLNLLQPDFVMSVGDLIPGYTLKEEDLVKQWDEFDGYVKKLQMPFFYVPGNHDLTNSKMIEFWGGRYGKSYYHFVYKNTLFISLNSEDGKASTIKPEQAAAIAKILDENKNVRWTLVFVHKPLWAERDLVANGWQAIETALAGRKYTVFCGHVHRYQKYVRNGMNYYQLATTGGGSKLRGVEYGEFDHLTWITMKPDGPLIANILMDGIYPENLTIPELNEEGTVVKKQPLIAIKGKVTLDGEPLAGVTVSFAQQEAPKGFRAANADGVTNADGEFVLTTYEKFDGVALGTFKVTVVKTNRGILRSEQPVESPVPVKYSKAATTPLVVEVKEGMGPIKLELTK